MKYSYIYLHGFASNHLSSKAQYFKNKLLPDEVVIPDMNMDDFPNLTLSRQLDQVSKLVEEAPNPVILFGSSMGGLTALLLAEKYPKIAKLILLAPAFKMSELWAKGDPSALLFWQQSGAIPIKHYAFDKELPLNYEFYLDLFKHDHSNFERNLPVLNFHGKNDNVVPIEFSREYQVNHPQSTLIELDDDHSLGNSLDFMWDQVRKFINKS